MTTQTTWSVYQCAEEEFQDLKQALALFEPAMRSLTTCAMFVLLSPKRE
jgi:hypothetical protein